MMNMKITRQYKNLEQLISYNKNMIKLIIVDFNILQYNIFTISSYNNFSMIC